MIIPVSLRDESYNIVLLRGALNNLNKYFNLNRRVLVVTDTGVPSEYLRTVLSQCENGYSVSIEEGEKSKSFWEKITPKRDCFSQKAPQNGFCGAVKGDLLSAAAAAAGTRAGKHSGSPAPPWRPRAC